VWRAVIAGVTLSRSDRRRGHQPIAERVEVTRVSD
jgi:hypothetical protein